jgi:hypothetical protein
MGFHGSINLVSTFYKSIGKEEKNEFRRSLLRNE